MAAALKSLSDYGLTFQVKVLNSLIKNRNFLSQIRDIVSEEYFDHIAHKWVVSQVLSYYDEYRIPPTLEYFTVECKKLENEVLKVGIKEQLKNIYQSTNTDFEYVENEFSTFCQNQKIKQALLESVDLLKQGEFESIRAIIEEAIKAGQNKDIGHRYKDDFEARYEKNIRNEVPTPWDVINSLLQGGLGSGDFGLIFGGPGGGKSWALIALGAYALSLGYKVIHYTLELGDKYVGKRYDACLTKIPVQDVKDHKEQIKEYLSQFEDNLIIKEYPPKHASLNTIKGHIQKSKDLGFDADLILIDYVDLLKPPSKRKERKEDLDDLYYGTKGLAKELQVPIWSVSQVNRDGAKDKIVEGDKAAGSYDKMMIADFLMSQSRLRKDKTDGTGRWHIMKNRYGMDGMTYNVTIDTSMGTFDVIGEYDEDGEPQAKPQKPNYSGIEQDEKAILKDKFKSFNIG